MLCRVILVVAEAVCRRQERAVSQVYWSENALGLALLEAGRGRALPVVVVCEACESRPKQASGRAALGLQIGRAPRVAAALAVAATVGAPRMGTYTGATNFIETLTLIVRAKRNKFLSTILWCIGHTLSQWSAKRMRARGKEREREASERPADQPKVGGGDWRASMPRDVYLRLPQATRTTTKKTRRLKMVRAR